MILFNEPGFCWDGENKEGKYQRCVNEVLPEYIISEGLRFDSVYVYTQRYYDHPDSVVSTVYVSARYPVVLKSIRKEKNTVVETRQITSFTRK